MPTQTKNITIRCTPEMLANLDLVRSKEPDVPTRAEMLRRLVERAAR